MFVTDHTLNGKTSPFFISPQFCRVSGFSMVSAPPTRILNTLWGRKRLTRVWQRELLARDILVALPKEDKLRIMQAFRSWR